MKSPSPQYGAFTQLLHWATAILVVIAFILGPAASEKRIYTASFDLQRHWHETIGITVFVLTFIRIAWRLISRAPEPEALEPWMALAAKLVQGLLYLLLLLVPLSAILGAWLEGHPLTLLGGIDIQPILARSHELGAKIAHLHRLLGDSIIWLAGLHALAAIYHHYIRKDNVLASMLPASVTALLKRK